MSIENLRGAPVLVLGGSGHFGRHIARSLSARGQSVRVLSRRAAAARRILGDAVEIVDGDLTSAPSVTCALEGVRAIVFSVSAFSPRLIRRMRRIERDAVLTVLEEAQRTGIHRVVYISGYDLRRELIERLHLENGRIKLEIESSLAETDLDWTVLGSAPSMDLFFRMLRGDKLVAPGGVRSPVPSISALDVGEIAAQAALREDLGRTRIRMTGPEAFSFPQAAKRLSRILGRKITPLAVPLLPLRIAAIVTRPLNPFLWHVVGFLRLLNAFPEHLVSRVPQDHQKLVSAFDYKPVTLDEEARRRYLSRRATSEATEGTR